MSGKATARLEELNKAATEYFDKETKRLNAQYDFLTAMAKARGGAVGVQDINAEGAAKILVDSIDEFLGKAPETVGSNKKGT